MGYFKWYWTRHGFFLALWNFFGKMTVSKCVWSFFYNMGMATGAFFLTRKVIDKLNITGYI
jgi:hypothetical protein